MTEALSDIAAEKPVKRPWDHRLLCAGLAAFLLGNILVPAVGGLILGGDHPHLVFFSAGGTLSALLMLLGFACKIGGSLRGGCEVLGLHRISHLECLAAFPRALGIMIVGGIISLLWDWSASALGWEFTIPPTTFLMQSGSWAQVCGLSFSALAVAPLFEEVLFRRAIYGGLECVVKGPAAAILTALFFAAMHMSFQQLPGLMFFSLMWQWYYLRSKSLWSSVILHFFNNFFAVGLLMIGRCCEFDV